MKCEMKRDLRREMKCEMERDSGLLTLSYPGRHRNTGAEVPRKLKRRPTDTALADFLIKPRSLCRARLLIVFAHVVVPRSQKNFTAPPCKGGGRRLAIRQARRRRTGAPSGVSALARGGAVTKWRTARSAVAPGRAGPRGERRPPACRGRPSQQVGAKRRPYLLRQGSKPEGPGRALPGPVHASPPAKGGAPPP
jgi:hypothetical protein